jgi:endonuclease VIII
VAAGGRVGGVPEGHLIHHHARRHRAGLVGAERISSPQRRFPAHRVTGRLVDVDAHGKHLAHRWSDGAVVHVHLGKQGVLLDGPSPPPEPMPQVRMRVEGPALYTDLIAPMVCEVLDEDGWEAVRATLGPDPLREDADVDRVLAALVATSSPIGVALMDQAILAGVGNALRADVLNLVDVHPATPSDRLDEGRRRRLWDELVALMRTAAEAGAIPHTVYRQERCPRCGTPVQTGDVGGRTAYWCPLHQPPPDA